jgi:hypothetical protein
VHRRACSIAALAAIALTAAAAPSALAATSTGKGPSTTKNPYVLPVSNGVHIKSLFTVGDKPAGNGFKMVGIPDGLGASRDGNAVEVLMNHELRPDRGIVRRHGQKGAFVSQLRIDRRTLRVDAGRDFINPGVEYWDYVSQTYGLTPSAGGANPRNPADIFPAQFAPFARFCSSSLTKTGELYNTKTGRGYTGQIYWGNEEAGDESRVFGVLENGDAKQLPRQGLFSWEQTMAAPNRSDTTLVLGLEDAGGGQLWAYVGRKSKKGDAFRRAGLQNGTGFVIDAVDSAVKTDAEFRAAYPTGDPAEVELKEVEWDASGARQNAEAAADGLTLNRIEDGAFDPQRPDDFYFVTTEGAARPDGSDGGGVWRLRFEDIETPELGGELTLLLDGSEDWGSGEAKLFKPDNVELDARGNFLIQEDPGGNAHLARILAYNVRTGDRKVLARFDGAIFGPGSADPAATIDEESSGVLDATKLLGSDRFLFDAQVHKAYTTGGAPAGYAADPAGELVEFGQLLTMKVSWDEVWGHGHHHDD